MDKRERERECKSGGGEGVKRKYTHTLLLFMVKRERGVRVKEERDLREVCMYIVVV